MPRQYTTKPARLLKRTGNHVRTDLGDEAELRLLARSFLARPIYPIICNPDLEILEGNRRQAGVMLERPDAEVPVCITDEVPGPAATLEIQMESANHTRALDDFEQYIAAAEWLVLNPRSSAKDLALRIHRDEGVLCKLLSLSKGIQPVKDAACARLIGYSKWYPICRRPPEEQAALLAASLSGATRDELQQASRPKGARPPAVRLPSIKIPLATTAATGTVTVAGEAIDLDDAETLLKEALVAVRAAKGKLDTKTAQAVWKDMAKAKPKPHPQPEARHEPGQQPQA